MSEEEKQSSGEERQPVVYASPLKRIWAWVGVAYMVIIVLLLTYQIAFAGFLKGIGSIMVIPALAGVGVSMVHLWRAGARKDAAHRIVLALVVAACAVLILVNLVVGIPALIADFGA